MYGYVLQDWITIRGAAGTNTSITQGEQSWMGFAPYQDIVFWLEVREVTLASATNVTVNYETAPSKDESLFLPMVTGVAVTAALATPAVTKVILAQNPTVPLARWVRWKLNLTGTASASWDMTFRVLCAANAISVVG
jgi:hypothetical protein